MCSSIFHSSLARPLSCITIHLPLFRRLILAWITILVIQIKPWLAVLLPPCLATHLTPAPSCRSQSMLPVVVEVVQLAVSRSPTTGLVIPPPRSPLPAVVAPALQLLPA